MLHFLPTKSALFRTMTLLFLFTLTSFWGSHLLYASSKDTIYSKVDSQDIIRFGEKYIGKPYRGGGKGPSSFDCSGFTSYVFKNFGISLAASSRLQDKQLPSIQKRGDLQPGDLVFFEGRRRNGKVGHVGILTEILPNGQFKFVHSATSRGVIVSRSSEPYYASRYLRGGRALNTLPIAQKEPVKQEELLIVEVPSVKKKKTRKERKEEELLLAQQSTHAPVSTRNASNNTVILSRNVDSYQVVSYSPSEADTHIYPNLVADDTSNANQQSRTTAITHRIQKGDTLYSLAKKYNCTVQQLQEWNPSLSANLRIGQSVKILNT